MTGGPHGTHRGRVADPTGGAHWWRGDGPTGGGRHAGGGPRRRALLALLALAAVALLAAGIATVVLSGREAPDVDAAPGAVAGSAPVQAGTTEGTGGTAAGPPDGAVLQDRLDAVLAAAPIRFAPTAVEPLPGAGIDPAAAALREAPGVPVTVEGHTAPIGADGTRSQELSELRAADVAADLAALGVDPERLRVVGRGDAEPRGSLDESRRVELRVG